MAATAQPHPPRARATGTAFAWHVAGAAAPSAGADARPPGRLTHSDSLAGCKWPAAARPQARMALTARTAPVANASLLGPVLAHQDVGVLRHVDLDVAELGLRGLCAAVARHTLAQQAHADEPCQMGSANHVALAHLRM